MSITFNPLPAGGGVMTYSDVTEARNRGWDDRDSRSPMLLQEERAGVKIAVDPAAIEKVREAD